MYLLVTIACVIVILLVGPMLSATSSGPMHEILDSRGNFSIQVSGSWDEVSQEEDLLDLVLPSTPNFNIRVQRFDIPEDFSFDDFVLLCEVRYPLILPSPYARYNLTPVHIPNATQSVSYEYRRYEGMTRIITQCTFVRTDQAHYLIAITGSQMAYRRNIGNLSAIASTLKEYY